MWTIALKSLIADRGKLLTALVGVVFSVVLVNVQGGLFLGLIRKAGLLVNHCQADIWVGHRHMHNVDFPQVIPRRWIHRVRSIPGVKLAEPYQVGWGAMTLPSGGHESLVIVGSSRPHLLGTAWNLKEGDFESLLRTDGIVVDELEGGKLDHPQLGEIREINGRRARVVAKSHGILGFLVAPYLFTTEQRALAYLERDPDMCSYYLVQLQEGVNPASMCRLISNRVPQVDAMTSDDFARLSINFWMTRTGLGISFGAATLLGLAVGLIMVSQTLYASVLDRMEEFAALKALGAKEVHVYSILFVQALIMALLGSVIGLLLVAIIQYQFHAPKAPIVVPWWLSAGSGVAVVVICVVSSLLPYLRIRKVDPAMVLQG